MLLFLFIGPPVLASLLQPSWELLNTFDRLLLLSHGQVVYWGAVKDGTVTGQNRIVEYLATFTSHTVKSH